MKSFIVEKLNSDFLKMRNDIYISFLSGKYPFFFNLIDNNSAKVSF